MLFKAIMSNSLLVEIPFDSLPSLRDKFKIQWPTHITAYSLIDNFISRFSKNPESKEIAKVQCLNGDWESDGTFIAVMVREKTFSQYIFILSHCYVLARERNRFRHSRPDVSKAQSCTQTVGLHKHGYLHVRSKCL